MQNIVENVVKSGCSNVLVHENESKPPATLSQTAAMFASEQPLNKYFKIIRMIFPHYFYRKLDALHEWLQPDFHHSVTNV